MADIESRLTDLRAQHAQAQQSRMRAEMELDAAKAAVTKSVKALKVLGVSSVEEAEKKAAELEATLGELISQAEAKIEESRGD